MHPGKTFARVALSFALVLTGGANSHTQLQALRAYAVRRLPTKWFGLTIKNFAKPNAGRPAPVAYKLPYAPHLCYLSDQAFVVRAMREFVLGNVGK